jgi:hypothetical protein
VEHSEETPSTAHAEQHNAFLGPRMPGVGNRDRQRIVKRSGRLGKGHAVLGQVSRCLLGVPFESHDLRSRGNVHAFSSGAQALQRDVCGLHVEAVDKYCL